MSQSTADTAILHAETFNAFRPILGRIAHDFNNLLTPLIAYPSLLRTYIDSESQGQDLVNAIEKAAQDMMHINEQLMLLASQGAISDTDTSIAELINSVLLEIGQTADLSRASIIKNIEEGLPQVTMSTPHLSKALSNLILNAFESRQDEVCINISVRRVQVEREVQAKAGAPYSAEHVQICISDDGPGFSEELLTTAAVPFVTTKKEMKQRGAGLGLSIALLVSRDHGGFLLFDNNPQGGATVSIYLPVEKEDAADNEAEPSAGTSTSSIPVNKNRLLVVDDEETIRKLFHMIISSSMPDYEIDTAANGREALDLFEKHHYAGLVMDLHMPVMDGQTAFQEIMRLSEEKNWEQPSVVFCTGFAPPETISRIVSDSGKHCLLSKPVRGEVLVDTIKAHIA